MTQPDLATALDRLASAGSRAPGPVEIGDLLFAAVAAARHHQVNAEAALRATAARFRDEVRTAELGR